MMRTQSRRALGIQLILGTTIALITGKALAQDVEAGTRPAPSAPPAALASDKDAPETARPEAPSQNAAVQPEGGDKVVSGMSIVGNDEAPKALVIVPWKTSDLGDTLDVSRLVDDGRTPVDREVFSRALDYYEIRTGNDR